MRWVFPVARLILLLALPPGAQAAAEPEPANALLVFAGRMSTSDMASTAIFNLAAHSGTIRWDNNIAGVEYERTLMRIAPGWSIRAEGGIDDRYGHYAVCCLAPSGVYHPDITVYSGGVLNSYEVWAGGKIRRDGIQLGSGLRMELAFTVGLSDVTDSIGRERQREMDYQGNARFLGYLAPEVGLAMPSLPKVELVMRLQHRSGLNGTFDHMREGYNAMTLGLRYLF